MIRPGAAAYLLGTMQFRDRPALVPAAGEAR